jgi:hypothetical protein
MHQYWFLFDAIKWFRWSMDHYESNLCLIYTFLFPHSPSYEKGKFSCIHRIGIVDDFPAARLVSAL